MYDDRRRTSQDDDREACSLVHFCRQLLDGMSGVVQLTQGL